MTKAREKVLSAREVLVRQADKQRQELSNAIADQ